MNPVLAEAIDNYKPVKVFACFSGGNDSLVSTHLTMTEISDATVLHVNTGIGIEETRNFVRNTCKEYGWPLNEMYPPNMTYEEFVLKYGFPGPAAHRYAYSWLKERAIRKAVRESKRKIKDKVMLVTGVRLSESSRRMGYVKPIQKVGATVWVAPIFDMTTPQREEYIDNNELDRNRVSLLLGMSGECLCGAYAKPGELNKLSILFPEVAKQIRELEAKVEAQGVTKHHWGINQYSKDEKKKFMPFCVGCEGARKT